MWDIMLVSVLYLKPHCSQSFRLPHLHKWSRSMCFKYSSRPLNVTSHMFRNLKWWIMWNFMFVPVLYLKPHGSQSFWLQHQHKWSRSMCFDNSSRPLNVTSHTFYNLKWWIMWDFMLVSNLSLKPHCSQSSPWLMSSSPDVWISSRKSNYMIPGWLEFICYCKVL